MQVAIEMVRVARASETIGGSRGGKRRWFALFYGATGHSTDTLQQGLATRRSRVISRGKALRHCDRTRTATLIGPTRCDLPFRTVV